jgi:hypothetical protein
MSNTTTTSVDRDSSDVAAPVIVGLSSDDVEFYTFLTTLRIHRGVNRANSSVEFASPRSWWLGKRPLTGMAAFRAQQLGRD